jgi:hypothetical protein
MSESRNRPLRFILKRNRGADTVATGVQFADGYVVIRWIGEHPSTQTYSDWCHAMHIHHIGEPGSGDRWTTAEWLDGVCFACGAEAQWISGGNGSQCLACSSGWNGPPDRVSGESKSGWRGIELPAMESPDGS